MRSNLSDTRLRYLWCVLTGGILLMSTLPGGSLIHQVVGTSDLNRWVHFLAYVMAVTITFAAWKGRIGVLLTLVIAAFGLGLELSQASILGQIATREIILADLFGLVGGTLLGLNIRLLRSSIQKRSDTGPSMSFTTSSSRETTSSLNAE